MQRNYPRMFSPADDQDNAPINLKPAGGGGGGKAGHGVGIRL